MIKMTAEISFINSPIKQKNHLYLLFKKEKIIPMEKEKNRYSDVELQEFKDLILEKLKEAEHDYSLLSKSLSLSDDHGTDDTGRTFNMMEDGSETLSREEVAQLAARQEQFIQSLKNALVRIENKTYGIGSFSLAFSFFRDCLVRFSKLFDDLESVPVM
jgi:RNA polymerase-binding transcription factor DksA